MNEIHFSDGTNKQKLQIKRTNDKITQNNFCSTEEFVKRIEQEYFLIYCGV